MNPELLDDFEKPDDEHIISRKSRKRDSMKSSIQGGRRKRKRLRSNLREYRKMNVASRNYTELRFEKFCNDLGIFPDIQKMIGSYTVDFLFPGNVVLELDGSYHNNPEQIPKDIERAKIIEEMGYTVLRFKNKLVWKKPEQILHCVFRKMKINGCNPENELVNALKQYEVIHLKAVGKNGTLEPADTDGTAQRIP